MLCVIPDPPGCCTLVTVPFDLKTLMFRIDNRNKTPWPQKLGFKVEGLSLGEKHLVVVYSGGKPIQSFRTGYPTPGCSKFPSARNTPSTSDGVAWGEPSPSILTKTSGAKSRGPEIARSF